MELIPSTLFIINVIITTTTFSLNATSFSHFEAAFQGKCSAPNNPCVQLCTELFNNAFECHCTPGYILSVDGYNCIQLTNDTENIQQLPLASLDELQNYYYNVSEDDNGTSGGGLDAVGLGQSSQNNGNTGQYTSSSLGVDEIQLLESSTCISLSSSPSTSSSDNYLVLPILSNAYINDNIYIEFKPNTMDGLLLLSGESYDLQNDYIIILIQDGYVVFKFDCGTGPGILKSLNQVLLNEWNTLNIIRYKWNSWLQLNNYHYNHGKSQGLFSRITFRIPVFVGGANTSTPYPSFTGQIRKLLINKQNYLNDVIGNCCTCLHGGICVNNECSCPFGYSGRSCEYFVDLQIPYFNETSYLKFKSLLNGTTTYLTLDIVLKPLAHDGVIIYSGNENLENEVTDYVCLLLNQGYVEFYTDLGNGVGLIKSEVKLSLDTWHQISITISSRLINLEINGISFSNHIPGAFNQLTLENNWYLGGIPNSDWLVNNKINVITGFNGCIQKVLVNEGLINLMGSALIGINIENCEHDCNSKPCGRNGFCVPDLNNYRCMSQIEMTRSNNRIPRFTGNSFLKFTDTNILQKFAGTSLNLQMEIRTSHSSGLILFTSYNQHLTNDYLKVYLRDGYLNLIISLGSGYRFIKYPKLRLNDDHWHLISITRKEQEVKVSIDEGCETVVTYIPGKLSNFNVHGGVFIGGVENSETSASVHQSDPTMLGFIGCVRNLFVNDGILSFENSISRNLNSC